MGEVIQGNLVNAKQGEVWIDRDGKRFRFDGMKRNALACMYPLPNGGHGTRLVPVNDLGWMRNYDHKPASLILKGNPYHF